MTSFSKDFLNVTKTMDSKVIDQRVVNAGSNTKYLQEGDHDVTVAGVDKNKLPENKFVLKYVSQSGAEHNDQIPLLEQNRKTGQWEWHWKFSRTMAALLPNLEAIEAFNAEVMSGNADVLDMLVGLRSKITLKRGKGYGPVRTVTGPDGVQHYEVWCTQTQACVGEGSTIEEAQAEAERAGYKKAYLNVASQAATDPVENVKKFEQALAASRAPVTKPFPFKVAANGIPF